MADRINSVQEYFDKLQDRFIAEAAKGVNTKIMFDMTGDGGGQWTVSIADQAVSVSEGSCEKPKVTVIMSATDYVDMANGDLDGTKAYMTRKLKVKGSIPMAQKMKKFLPPTKK